MTTLFPKITGKATELLYAIRKEPRCKGVSSFPLVGTVKLHGAHADIVIDRNDNVRLQSRNRLEVTMEDDLYGLASFLLPLRKEILVLKVMALDVFGEICPSSEVNPECPVIFAGEWIGYGIQKGVAIAKMESECFVILGVSINGRWESLEPYSHIANMAVGIHNIAKAGLYYETLDLVDYEESMKRLQRPTLEVEKRCPFAFNAFGLEGTGEGIVWRFENELGNDPNFWFKTKGPKFSRSDAPTKPKESNEDGVALAKDFVNAVIDEMRLKQGLDYLREMGIAHDKKGLGSFVKWLTNDVLVEEKGEIDNSHVDVGLLKKEIANVSRLWYLEKLDGKDGLEGKDIWADN